MASTRLKSTVLLVCCCWAGRQVDQEIVGLKWTQRGLLSKQCVIVLIACAAGTSSYRNSIESLIGIANLATWTAATVSGIVDVLTTP